MVVPVMEGHAETPSLIIITVAGVNANFVIFITVVERACEGLATALSSSLLFLSHDATDYT